MSQTTNFEESASKGIGAPATNDFDKWVQGLAEREAKLRARLKATYEDNDLRNRRTNLDVIFEELQKLYDEGRRPICEDLEKLNLEKDKWGNFQTNVSSFRPAVPIVIEHLRKGYLSRVRQHLAYDLASPIAKDAWKDLVDLYCMEPAQTDAKDGLANALAATVTRATLLELIEIIRDRSHGTSRVLLLVGIRRFRIEQAKRVLHDFADDPDLKVQIAEYKKKDAAQLRKTRKGVEICLANQWT